MGPAKGGRQILVRIADEIQLQGHLPTGHLGLLVRVDRYTWDELHDHYREQFPDGSRPLTRIVTEEVVKDFRSRETNLESLAAAVARAFKKAYVAEQLAARDLSSEDKDYPKVRRQLDAPILTDEFWRPYQSGMRAGLRLARAKFDARPTIWVPTRKSQY